MEENKKESRIGLYDALNLSKHRALLLFEKANAESVKVSMNWLYQLKNIYTDERYHEGRGAQGVNT